LQETPIDASVPAAQGWHSVAPAGLMLPAGQLASQDGAPAPLTFPASQAWHVLLPSSSCLPALHGSHALAPVEDT
jgi:hypothetical protein